MFVNDTNLTAAANSITELQDAENFEKTLVTSQQTKPKCSQVRVYVNSLKIYDKNISNSAKIYIENQPIKKVRHEYKTLGVKIDHLLSWKSDTKNICKKVSAGI